MCHGYHLSHIRRSQDTSNNLVERSDVPEINARRGELGQHPSVWGHRFTRYERGDPIIVLRRYGIEDPSKIEEYSAMYERFILSDMANVSEYIASWRSYKIGDDIYKGSHRPPAARGRLVGMVITRQEPVTARRG